MTGGSPLGYDTLLEASAPSDAARRDLLEAYFEPTEQEREDGLKQPTAAHRALARLIADGQVGQNGLGLTRPDAVANVRALRARLNLLAEDVKVSNRLLEILDTVECAGSRSTTQTW